MYVVLFHCSIFHPITIANVCVYSVVESKNNGINGSSIITYVAFVPIITPEIAMLRGAGKTKTYSYLKKIISIP